MYRLLIVDDEPAIVDGLGQLFMECGMDLDVWKAASSAEALDVVRKMQVDLVLSDIRMPEVNGLQLVDEILSYWPACQIIFLTGYSEFEYAYAAFQKNVANYILKHEDDDTLLAAVQAVIDKLEEEKRNGERMEQAMRVTEYAQPLIRKQLLEAVLLGEAALELMQQQPFSSVSLQVSMDRPVLLLVGFVRKAEKGHKLPTFYAIQRLFQTASTSLLTAEELIHDHSALVWLVQPNPGSGRLTMPDGSPDWTATASYLKGMLETVQNSCQELLGIDVTFLLSSLSVQWEELSSELEHIRGWMRKREWLLPGMAIIDLGSDLDVQLGEHPARKLGELGDSRSFESWLQQLEQALREGDEETAYELNTQILTHIRQHLNSNYAEGTRTYLCFALVYMTHACNGDIPTLWEGGGCQPFVCLGSAGALGAGGTIFRPVGPADLRASEGAGSVRQSGADRQDSYLYRRALGRGPVLDQAC